jgi:hypothetical protein
MLWITNRSRDFLPKEDLQHIQTEMDGYFVFPFALFSQKDMIMMDSIMRKMRSMEGVRRVDFFLPLRVWLNEDWLPEAIQRLHV